LETSVQSTLASAQALIVFQQYDAAIQQFYAALKMQQQYLLPNHPSIANTYEQIAHAYYNQKRYLEAVEFYTKTLEIEQSSLADDHPNIASTYYNFARAYLELLKFDEALEYGQKAIEQLSKTNEFRSLIFETVSRNDRTHLFSSR
jgi:tetratricopeptide (TPR) repeat protein